MPPEMLKVRMISLHYISPLNCDVSFITCWIPVCKNRSPGIMLLLLSFKWISILHFVFCSFKNLPITCCDIVTFSRVSGPCPVDSLYFHYLGNSQYVVWVEFWQHIPKICIRIAERRCSKKCFNWSQSQGCWWGPLTTGPQDWLEGSDTTFQSGLPSLGCPE